MHADNALKALNSLAAIGGHVEKIGNLPGISPAELHMLHGVAAYAVLLSRRMEEHAAGVNMVRVSVEIEAAAARVLAPSEPEVVQ